MDLDSIAFAIGSPKKVNDLSGSPLVDDKGRYIYQDKTEDEIVAHGNKLMKEILVNSKATHYIAFIKGKGNFRYESNSTYKSNRPQESPKWWDFVKQYLIQRWGAVEVNGIEVDDAVNIARLKYVTDSFICAIDKDLLNLIGYHFNWRKKEWVNTTEEQEEFAFWSDMIAGQPGDGVKGIPQKGIKYAEKVLKNDYRETVLREYVKHFGEYNGIKEFYKNYISLKILDEYEGFVVPEPIEYNINESKKEVN